jgi:arylsulfatase A-like enzyme
MMSGKTPKLDMLAAQGMMFTDYYAEASCTAGRANFITGELPIRTGMTTVGQPGADVGLPAEASTIAVALKSMGYATAQFGKNHLGDLNKFLPTVHGFDEFFGYLYHLDAMSDPFWYSYPTDPAIRNRILPRNLVHSYATDVDDATLQPRWGKIGKQRIIDEGPLAPGPNTGRTIYGGAGETTGGAKYDMTTFDEVVVENSVAFMKKAKAKAEGKPFFVWHNTTRSHVWSFLSEHYKSLMNAETNFGLEEAGMAQLDDSVGALLKALDDMGEANNTIVVFSTDNGAETFTWPDGGITPFRASKGTIYEGGFRVPAIIRWPGHVKPGTVENGIFSGPFPIVQNRRPLERVLANVVDQGHINRKLRSGPALRLGVGPRLLERVHGTRSLAVRRCTRRRGPARGNRHRLPADAGACVLQPECRQSENRRGDQGARRPVVGRK